MQDDPENFTFPPEPYLGMEGYDGSPLAEGLLVRYQFVALIPAFATNFHYELYEDGRLYFAQNVGSAEEGIFDTPLPSEPNRVVAAETLAAIKAAIAAEDFFAQPPYKVIKARGGSLKIVKIRLEGQQHEVWYENVSNSLLAELHAIGPDEPAETSLSDQLEFWDSLWEEAQGNDE